MSEYAGLKLYRQVSNKDRFYLIHRYFFRHLAKWIPLILPEDTSQATEVQQYRRPTPESAQMFGIVKTVLWIIISIGLSLLIGQLK